ncbi:hypothetical protein [Jatrophihabitans sp.]|uniref:hypothetical protein n=1 Tax=Jatrophihabitans sp. TaxID=1932789 RepID=UPI0030C75240|nr:hypothetical protein [Jatrophihabitans sp.]
MAVNLPGAPAFPVYGLSDRVEGLRWLCTWQRWPTLEAGVVWQLCIGHGDPSQGPYALVTTTLKQLPWPESEHGPAVQSGLDHAVSNAISNLVSLSCRSDPDEEHRTLLAELERFTEVDGVGHFDGWELEDVPIEGVRQGVHLRRLPKAWAFAAELAGVVVTGWSTDDIPFELVELIDLSEDIASIELLPPNGTR